MVDPVAMMSAIQLLERQARFVQAAQLLVRLRQVAATADNNAEWEIWRDCTDRDRLLLYAGIALMHSRRYGEALEMFTHTRSRGFPRKPALYYAGLCCLHLQDLQKAAESFRLLLTGMPQHVDAWFNLGNAEYLAGNPAEAEHCYRQAISLEPDFAEAIDNLARLRESPQPAHGALQSRYWKNWPQPDDFWQVPIFINCRDRVSALRRLVDWLQAAGYKRIILLDNASSFPPLLAYYEEIAARPDKTAIQLIRLGENLGHQALWRSGILQRLQIRGPFVYSDPDIVPIAECPHDIIRVFWRILAAHPFVQKVGFGLKLDDLPDHFAKKAAVLFHETHFWEHRLPQQSPSQYLAPIDTTFALYRHGNYYEVPCSIRTGYPYLARHDDWYVDSDQLPEETSYYYRHAESGVSWTQEL